MEEPHENEWLLERVDGGVRVRVFHLPDSWMWSPEREAEERAEPGRGGVLVLDTVEDPMVLARSVLGVFDAVLAAEGLEGYHEKWDEFRFPVEGLARLRALVA